MHSHCVQRKKESELILLQSSLLLRITRNELVADAGFRTGKILIHSLFTSTFKIPTNGVCQGWTNSVRQGWAGDILRERKDFLKSDLIDGRVTFCGKGKVSKNRILLLKI